MDKPVELVPLVCLQCSTPIAADVEEVAWVCPQCGKGMLLDLQKGLLPLQVNYASTISPDAAGKPFWVAMGRVTLQRETFGFFGDQDSEAAQFWGDLRQFFIPAFACTLEEMIEYGTRLLRQPPELQPGSPARFEAVTLPSEDIHLFAEFIVMAIEAERSDKARLIDFNVQLHDPVLWILP